MRFVCQIVALAVCALSASVVAQGVTGTVRVEVQSEDGPVPGATVTLGDLSAVTDPSVLKAGFNALSTSTVESGLIVSSRAMTRGEPFG